MRIKKHIPTIIALTAVLTLGVSLYVNINNSPAEAEAYQVNENFAPYTYSGTYYSDHNIDFNAGDGMNGALRTKLRTELKPKGFVDYSSGLSDELQEADEDPNNTDNMVMFYTRNSITKTPASNGGMIWNREHVWPKNKSNDNWGTTKGGTDILHLRPTYETPNSTRSNHPYGYAHNGTKKSHLNMDYGWLDGDIFEPLDCVKGDAARIIMYVWTVYDGYSGYNPLSITSVFESFDTLLEWHTMDKPDALEGHRNDYVQNSTVQKNRNPFVDHPELAWKIFGDANGLSASVKNACMAAYPDGSNPIDPTGITLNKTTASVEVGKTTQLTATLEPYGASGNITWSSSNTTVATVNNNGLVTGKAVGESTITATCGTFSASCVVTVAETVNIYGTLENPLTVSEARQLIDDVNGGYTAEKMYVKGTVSSGSYNTQYSNFNDLWLQSEDGETANYFDLYHAELDDSVPAKYTNPTELEGKEVIAYGYGKKYNSTYELAPQNNNVNKPVILSVKDPNPIEKTAKELIEEETTSATLAYRYTKEGNGSSSVTDALTRDVTGVENGSTSYIDWTHTNSTSAITYKGQSAGNYDSIQIRSDKSNSGVVVSANTNSSKVSSVTVAWNTNTSNGRTLNVYGKNTAYTSPTDLYGNNQGTLLGTIVKGTSTSLAITGDYQYIGLRSNSGAMYLEEIDIQWGGASAAVFEYSDVSIRFTGSLSQDLWNDLDTENHVIEGFGVMITAVSSYVNGTSKIKEQYQSAVISTDNPDVTEDIVNYFVPKETKATPTAKGNDYYWNLKYNISETDFKTIYVAAAYIKTATEYVFFNQARYSVKTLAADYINERDYNPTTANGSLANLANL